MAATVTQPLMAPAVGQKFQPPPSVIEAATRGDELITGEILGAAWEGHGAAVVQYGRFLMGLEELSKGLEDSLAVIAELA
jgi:hypothetical protein